MILETTQNQRITSRNSVSIRRLRNLQTRAGREQTGLFLAEGIRHVAQAVEQNAPIETLIVAPEVLKNLYGQKLVRQLRRQNVPLYSLTPEVYHNLSQAEEPSGIAVVVRQKWERLDSLRSSLGLCWVAVEAVQSHGNLGTILRTCEAVGGAGLILIGDAGDPFDPATVRASMGAIFNQRLVRTTVTEFGEWKRRRQCMLIGTSPSATTDYQAVAYPGTTILLMGSEKKGLSAEMQALCDQNVKIPMVGRSDSLNVAVATSVLLYEVFNQKRSRGR